jgi:hypothetical protein
VPSGNPGEEAPKLVVLSGIQEGTQETVGILSIVGPQLRCATQAKGGFGRPTLLGVEQSEERVSGGEIGGKREGAASRLLRAAQHAPSADRPLREMQRERVLYIR